MKLGISSCVYEPFEFAFVCIDCSLSFAHFKLGCWSFFLFIGVLYILGKLIFCLRVINISKNQDDRDQFSELGAINLDVNNKK